MKNELIATVERIMLERGLDIQDSDEYERIQYEVMTSPRFTVSAVRSGERYYLTTTTDLAWRTMVHLSAEPVYMTEPAAASVAKIAGRDDTLHGVTVADRGQW